MVSNFFTSASVVVGGSLSWRTSRSRLWEIDYPTMNVQCKRLQLFFCIGKKLRSWPHWVSTKQKAWRFNVLDKTKLSQCTQMMQLCERRSSLCTEPRKCQFQECLAQTATYQHSWKVDLHCFIAWISVTPLQQTNLTLKWTI